MFADLGGIKKLQVLQNCAFFLKKFHQKRIQHFNFHVPKKTGFSNLNDLFWVFGHFVTFFERLFSKEIVSHNLGFRGIFSSKKFQSQ